MRIIGLNQKSCMMMNKGYVYTFIIGRASSGCSV